MKLSEGELNTIKRHVTSAQQYQALTKMEEQAAQDLLNVAFLARELKPENYSVELSTGEITKIEQKPTLVEE